MRKSRNEWSLEGLCQRVDPEEFFQTKQSKVQMRICEECPVFELCRDYAMLHEDYGVWGGTTDRQRKKFRKTPEFEKLAYKAIKEGWLESHHVIPKSVYKELKELAEIQANPQRVIKSDKPIRSLDLAPFDFGALLASQSLTEQYDFSSDKKPREEIQTLGDLLNGPLAS